MKPTQLGPRELQGIQVMINALPFYAMLVDAEHQIIAVNDATEAALGVTRDEIICQYCPRAIHGQDEPYDGCPLEQAVSTGRHVEVEIYDHDLQRWFLSSVSPTEMEITDGGRIYLHFTQDITEKKEAAADLDRSLEHHRAVAEVLQRVQACRSASRVLEEVIDRVLSLSWSGMTGSAAGFLCEGSLLRMVVHRNLDPEVARDCASVPLGHCLCGKAAEDGEQMMVDCVGEHHLDHTHQPDHGHVILPLRHMDQTLAVLSFYLPEGGKLEPDKVAALEIIANLSAVALGRLQMQVQLAQSDRMASLGLLASILAHDIRTPLNALSIQIQGTSRRFKNDRPPDPAELPGLLDGLQAEVQRINQQIEEHLLAIVRHEPQRMNPVAANDVVAETAQFMEPEADFKNVKIRCTLTKGLPPVSAEPNKLRRILLNLILNAIQAMPHGGEVHLATRMDHQQVVLSVADQGTGFSEPRDGELSEVFQPFVTTKKDGTGLGLAICARLIREINGSIRCHSRPGEGARFDLLLKPA